MDELVHHMISAQARRTPEGTALLSPTRSVSFAELDRYTNQLARFIRARGAVPESIVGLCNADSTTMLLSIIACFKSGAAYLPLDPAYPADRLQYMVADARPGLIIGDSPVARSLGGEDVEVISLPEADNDIAAFEDSELESTIQPSQLAYIIYTSGSTGRPKGAQLEHRNIANLARNEASFLGLRPGQRMMQFASFSFDCSLWDTLAALTAGATVVLPPPECRLPGSELTTFMREFKVNIATLTPSVLAVLRDVELPDLEILMSGSEACSYAIIDKWRKDGRRVYNGYGPTEATVACVFQDCSDLGPCDRVPIGSGREFDGVTVAVINPTTQTPAKTNEPGELWIGGKGVARGYLRRPGLTAERFVPDAFSGIPGGRMYRTGDKVSRNDRGQIEFHGRIDQQVKVNGFRIELGEVDSALSAHPSIHQAATVVIGDHVHRRRLLSFVVPAASDFDKNEVLETARERLPSYMLPSDIVSIEAFPQTPTGKLDRDALVKLGEQNRSERRGRRRRRQR